MAILGLHHITLGCGDAQRTVDFYVAVLGLRFVKRTVNFDDPGTYHLYFGDETGKPGTAITFFEWPGVPQGHPGIGGTHHFALTVQDRNGLLKWKRRLIDLGISVDGPFNRAYFDSIDFRDPDGTRLEIATQGPGFATAESHGDGNIGAETWPEAMPEITPDMALNQGMHHITAISSNLERTARFYEELMGLKRVKMTTSEEDASTPQWYWSSDEAARPGTLVSYFQRDPRQVGRAQMGAGQTHHFAFAVANDEEQEQWRAKLIHAGLNVSPIMDRSYFHSIYLRDPDGHVVEIATLNPGFSVDEPVAELGNTLKLPPWLADQRPLIERSLRPIHVPTWVKG